jgi:hypothetical protein
MSEKPKCSQCHERDVFSKGLCSGCYGKNWRAARKAERDAAIAEQFPPKQLTSGVTGDEMAVIEGEIVHDGPPDPHLVALNPAQMEAARGDMKAWLEDKLTVIERDIIEANAALNEARKNGWATGPLVAARNRAVDDETFYNKILAAVEAGHTIIPDFPVEVFAVRRAEADREREVTFNNAIAVRDTFLGEAVSPDCAPAGAGEYRNPQPWTSESTYENKAPGAQERNEPRWYTRGYRSSGPIGPIVFPSVTARSPIMRATAKAMKDKVFDQIGVCHPVIADTATAARRVERNARRAGDPLVVGQILRKRIGGQQKCVSFIIAWHLNLNDL